MAAVMASRRLCVPATEAASTELFGKGDEAQELGAAEQRDEADER